MQIPKNGIIALLTISVVILLCVYILLGYVAHLCQSQNNIDPINPILSQIEHYKDITPEFHKTLVEISEKTMKDMLLSRNWAIDSSARAATTVAYLAAGIAAILFGGLTTIAITFINSWRAYMIQQLPAHKGRA